jgi:hypothetical protein
MPMAMIYATGTLLGSSWIDLDVMAGVHGSLNALGFALPAMVAWTLERRPLSPTEADRRPARDPRRLGLGAAAIIAGYALVVAAISARATANEFGPPELVPRPVLLAAPFMVPAAIAAIAAFRRSRPLLIAAGALCLGQSFIAFSGVTIPFIVPAFLLLALGASPGATGSTSRAMIGGVLVVLLGAATWLAPAALTEEACWEARTGPDGTLVYAPIPVPDTLFEGGGAELGLGPGTVASACASGSLTIQGTALGAVMGIGAVAVALLASTPVTPRAPREEFA